MALQWMTITHAHALYTYEKSSQRKSCGFIMQMQSRTIAIKHQRVAVPSLNAFFRDGWHLLLSLSGFLSVSGLRAFGTQDSCSIISDLTHLIGPVGDGRTTIIGQQKQSA